MSPSTFDHLLILIEDDLTKVTTNYRKSISPEERLVVTIRLVKQNLFPFLDNINDVSFQKYPLR